jgi:tRNA (guanine37-N1)-methyltransferase
MPFVAQILTLFPAMFPGPLGLSLAGQALQKALWQIKTLDIRDFSDNKHRCVDDTPAGGGPGMVMRADVVGNAIDAALGAHPELPLLALTPRGQPLTQKRVQALAQGPGCTLLCGRFEGIDERVFEARPIEQVSIGDYVLSGGELAALVLLDACVRLLPGVLGAPETLAEESFNAGLLEYPHYTRPRVWEGREIPEPLLSGDHARIKAWRYEQALLRTKAWRPDLLAFKEPA